MVDYTTIHALVLVLFNYSASNDSCTTSNCMQKFTRLSLWRGCRCHISPGNEVPASPHSVCALYMVQRSQLVVHLQQISKFPFHVVSKELVSVTVWMPKCRKIMEHPISRHLPALLTPSHAIMIHTRSVNFLDPGWRQIYCSIVWCGLVLNGHSSTV